MQVENTIVRPLSFQNNSVLLNCIYTKEYNTYEHSTCLMISSNLPPIGHQKKPPSTVYRPLCFHENSSILQLILSKCKLRLNIVQNADFIVEMEPQNLDVFSPSHNFLSIFTCIINLLIYILYRSVRVKTNCDGACECFKYFTPNLSIILKINLRQIIVSIFIYKKINLFVIFSILLKKLICSPCCVK